MKGLSYTGDQQGDVPPGNMMMILLRNQPSFTPLPWGLVFVSSRQERVRKQGIQILSDERYLASSYATTRME